MAVEDRFLIAIIGIILIFIPIFILGRKNRKKNSKNQPISLLILVLGILLFVLALQYPQVRPDTSAGVIIKITASVFLIAYISSIFWVIKEFKIFDGHGKYTVFRFLFLLFFYWMGYNFVSKGIIFTYNGILNLQSVYLNPQFELWIMPMLSGIVLTAFRLTKMFPSKISEIFNKVAEDVVVFSLVMAWLTMVTSGEQIEIALDFQFQNMSDATIWGITLGVISLVFEGFLVWFLKDLSKNKPYRSFTDEMFSLFSLALKLKKPNTQQTLDKYWSKKKKRKPKKVSGIHKAAEILDGKFSFNYRGKKLKASRIAFFSIMFMMVLFIIGNLAVKKSIVIVPAYSFDIKQVQGDYLPSNVTIINSEQMENLVVENNYAIPIVLVQYPNGTYQTPLNDRLNNLNSSQFEVTETGEFLLFNFKTVFVETYVKSPLISSIEYNQSESDSFDYVGLSRDAEILYCLNNFEYENVLMTTATSIEGMDILFTQKFIVANNSANNSILVYVSRKADMAIQDYTYFVSLDEDLVNQMIFQIEQTKMNTQCVPQIKEPELPFSLIN